MDDRKMATLFTIRTTTIIYSYGHWISKPKVHPQLIIGTVLSARELIEFLGKIVLASQFMCVWPKREINKRGIFGGISLLTGWNLLEYFVGAKSDEMNHAPHRSHNNRQRERSNCHPKHSPSQSPAFMDSIISVYDRNLIITSHTVGHTFYKMDHHQTQGEGLVWLLFLHITIIVSHQNITIIMMTMMMMVEENSARHNNIIKSIRTVMPAIVAHRNKYSPFLRTARKEFSGIQ